VEHTDRDARQPSGDGLVYVCAADGQITAFDATTGQQEWRATRTPTPNSWAPAPFLDVSGCFWMVGRSTSSQGVNSSPIKGREAISAGKSRRMEENLVAVLMLLAPSLLTSAERRIC
jgi:hypothetical protein